MTESHSEALGWIDEGTFRQADEPREDRDPLGYPSYDDALERARSRSGSDESVRTGPGRVSGRDCEVAFFEFGFLGGSMGEAAGERLARALERALERAAPFVLFTSTGGARMQEGMRSLVQMPKVVAARIALGEQGSPFIAVLTHPTTGGVLASLAALADVTIAVSGATVGFAGPRLVERQTGRPLREGSHSAISALEAGLVDDVVGADEVRGCLGTLMKILEGNDPAEPPDAWPRRDSNEGVRKIGGWEAVSAVRDPNRTRAPELASSVLSPLVELRGDRAGADDPGVRALLGRLGAKKALVLALDRDHPPGPHAYRKAIRAIEIAARMRVPVITLVDTPGADASEDSEAVGIAWAIAELFRTILTVPVPVLSVLTGEGGSGGALAFAAGDRLIAYDDTTFSVIAPELAAEILFRDPARARETASLLRLTASDLRALGIADELVPGPPDAESLTRLLAYHLGRLEGADPASRRNRWRSI